TMRSDTGRVRVVADDQTSTWQPVPLRRFDFARLRRASERDTGEGARKNHLAELGFGETLPGGLDHRGQARLQPKANVGGTRNALAQNLACRIGEARAAIGAAAID